MNRRKTANERVTERSRERERAYVCEKKKIRARSKKVKRCYIRREKKKRIYESLTCFVYVFTLYKIIERIIAIKIKTTSFTRKKKIIIDRTFAVECISLTFFLFLFLPTVSRGFREVRNGYSMRFSCIFQLCVNADFNA